MLLVIKKLVVLKCLLRIRGKVIDEWISSNKAHEIDGLESGKTYYLNEDTSPAGYVKATKIEFKVNEDGKIQKVNMKV